MDNLRTIKRNVAIADAIKQAQTFYKNNGFMDFSRFSGYFKKIKFKDNDHRIHSLTNWYCLFFGKNTKGVENGNI